MSIFVCYASSDRNEVDSLVVEASKNEGVNLWVAHIDGIPSAFHDETYIKSKIVDSDGAIIFLSKNFLNRKFIRDVELPAILKQKNNRKDYNIAILLVEDCDYKQVEYFRNRQFINSNSTALKKEFITSRQKSLILNEAIQVFKDQNKGTVKANELNINNSKEKRWMSKRFKATFLIILSILFLAFWWSYFNNTLETTVPETTVPETTVPETTVPETIVPETTVIQTENSNYNYTGSCLTNTYELWAYYQANFNFKFPYIETIDSWTIGCDELHAGEVFYTFQKNYMNPDDFTFEQRDEQGNNIDLKCNDEFQKFYGYSQHDGPYSAFNLWFLSEDEQKILILCTTVKMNINKEGWKSWDGLATEFNIDKYREDISYKNDINLNKFNIGDCGLWPSWVYSNTVVDQSKAINTPWPNVDCYSPHTFEVIDIFTTENLSGLSVEEQDKYLFDRCYVSQDLYSSLDEYELRRDKDGTDSTLIVWTDEPNSEGSYEKVYCLATWKGYRHQYKVDFSLLDSFNRKKYKLNYESSLIEPKLYINNCPKEAPATFTQDEWADTYYFNISWENIKEPLQGLSVFGGDPNYYFSYEANDLSRDLRYTDLSNWEIVIGASFEILESHEYGVDKGTFQVSILFGEGEEVSSTCTFDLFLQED